MKLIDTDSKNIGGIYQIRNIKNNKVYVGRTNCFYTRCCHHLGNFKRQKEMNTYLLRSILKSGIGSFVFEILEISNENLIQKEHDWIIKKKSINRKFGYNLRNEKDGIVKHDKSTILKIKKSKLRFYKNKKNLRNLSNLMKTSWNNKEKIKRIANGRLKSESKKATYKYYINGQGPFRCYIIKESEYQSALVKMWKYKIDSVIVKGSIIKRVSK